eukprot:3087182-Rhodomonas_salina.1
MRARTHTHARTHTGKGLRGRKEGHGKGGRRGREGESEGGDPALQDEVALEAGRLTRREPQRLLLLELELVRRDQRLDRPQVPAAEEEQ